MRLSDLSQAQGAVEMLDRWQFRAWQRGHGEIPSLERERMLLQAQHFEAIASRNQRWVDQVRSESVEDVDGELHNIMEYVEESRAAAEILRRAVELELEPAPLDVLAAQVDERDRVGQQRPRN